MNTIKKRVVELYLQMALNNVFTMVIVLMQSKADNITWIAGLSIISAIGIFRLNKAEDAQ
jgi:hypothetical protein